MIVSDEFSLLLLDDCGYGLWIVRTGVARSLPSSSACVRLPLGTK